MREGMGDFRVGSGKGQDGRRCSHGPRLPGPVPPELGEAGGSPWSLQREQGPVPPCWQTPGLQTQERTQPAVLRPLICGHSLAVPENQLGLRMPGQGLWRRTREKAPQRVSLTRLKGSCGCTALRDPTPTAVWRRPVLPGQGKGSPSSPLCPVCPSPRGPPNKTLKAKQKAAEMHVFKIYSKTMIALLFLDRNGAF